MRLFLTLRAAMAAMLLACLFPAAQAQQLHRVEMEGWRMRAPLALSVGANEVRLCNLVPGKSYTVVAIGGAQPLELALTPAEGVAGRFQVLQDIPGKKNAFHFVAAEECIDFDLMLKAKNDASASYGAFFSVKCEDCEGADAFMEKFKSQLEAANLSVQAGVNPNTLINDVLIGGDCYDVSNITASGNSDSRGTFSNGGTNIGIENGMVMSSGSVAILPGPNSQNNASGGFGFNSPNDPDLAMLVSGNQWDVSVIEFDFVPTASQVVFDFVFGSEEYCEYVGTQFNDVFGFFIEGPGITGSQNIGLIPGTTIPVATNNVNFSNFSNFYLNNTSFPPCTFIPPVAPLECELDGWTTVFQAIADLQPCETYRIKLAIADVGDALFTSAVFLRANSFDAGGTARVEPQYHGGLATAYEDCGNNFLRFIRDNSDNSQPLDINFSISGTATMGVDYDSIPTSVTIPAGQNEILVPVNIYDDFLSEGQETILLTLENPCACSQTVVSFTIEDKQAFIAGLDPPLAVCAGGSVSLTAEVFSGIGPFTYAWSNGGSSETITLTPAMTTMVFVTVSDVCGLDTTMTTVVRVDPPVVVSIDTALCAGEVIEVFGVAYSAPASVMDTLPGQNGQCDTLLNIQLQLLPLATFNETVLLCEGDSISIGGVFYSGPAVVVDTLPGLGADCDTVATYEIMMLNRPVRSDTIAFCPGDTVFIGGNPYFSEGVVLDTLPGLNGACDTIVTYKLESLTPAPSNVVITCPSNVVSGVGEQEVEYDLPVAGTDCVCPGLALTLVSGQESGGSFPIGESEVCYQATDSCGNSATCCFTVTVPEEEPCDVKVIGCIRIELLRITQNSAGNKTYYTRVTNNCSNQLVYVSLEIPQGGKAVNPQNNSVYTAPSGNQYDVRNPNYSPFTSVRFSSIGSGINNGERDVFQYTLNPQADPNYIHVLVRLRPRIFFEAYLNTFFCPVEMESMERGLEAEVASALRVFPNPSSGRLFADLSGWQGDVRLSVVDARGVEVYVQARPGGDLTDLSDATTQLPEGLYFLIATGENGLRETTSFVIQK